MTAKLTTLNIMRAMAALIVFFGHVRGSSFVEFGALPPEQQNILTKLLFGVTRLGHEAVMLFFVLSGFLVGGQIIRHTKECRFNIIRYCIDRIVRIGLPLVPACLLTAYINYSLFAIPLDWGQCIANMIGMNGIIFPTLSNNASLWTLTYEVWFYIIGGSVGYLLSTRRPSLVAFFVVSCCVCVFSLLAARYLVFWCVGALSVILLHHGQRRTMALAGLLFAIMGVAGYQMAAESKSFINVEFWPMPMSEALICIGISMIIPMCCDKKLNDSIKILHKPAAYLSSLSYSLYLFHVPINAALDKIFPRCADVGMVSIVSFIARVMVIFIGVNIIYLLFEANTNKFRRWLERRCFSAKEEFVAAYAPSE